MASRSAFVRLSPLAYPFVGGAPAPFYTVAVVVATISAGFAGMRECTGQAAEQMRCHRGVQKTWLRLPALIYCLHLTAPSPLWEVEGRSKLFRQNCLEM